MKQKPKCSSRLRCVQQLKNLKTENFATFENFGIELIIIIIDIVRELNQSESKRSKLYRALKQTNKRQKTQFI